MNAAFRCGTLVALLVFVNACRNVPAPTGPSMPAATTVATPSPLPGSGFPTVARPARIYLFTRELSYSVREWTKESRFVLYDDGTFALQYLHSAGSSEYRGTYTDANGLITFQWEGWSIAGPWGATGSLGDDSLTVRYNQIMELTDFENAVYLRTR